MTGTAERCPMSVMFTSKDMNKSVAFYRDTLGFTLAESWPSPEAPKWANLMLDGQSVMLGADMSPEDAAKMCGGDEGAATYMKTLCEEFKSNKPGVGIVTYVTVKDVDAYHKTVTSRGLKAPPPKTQFYGIRDFAIQDPDGYRLMFFTVVAMETCQSCGMPLSDAKPGQTYCGYCSDETGKLKPYEIVLEGTTRGYFMEHMKMPRPEAEKAAREHLKKMPAWAGRS